MEPLNNKRDKGAGFIRQYNTRNEDGGLDPQYNTRDESDGMEPLYNKRMGPLYNYTQYSWYGTPSYF